ncbi:M15 family metallopeptidase [Bacillus piscicola]|uniref:M15 family metallopeptidase n=1 Tax=Bacillus piscicola TaxID=1632684 RepID=UPI001F092B81|nr:M15 family metallopeptidase [Bacillus piscicola]
MSCNHTPIPLLSFPNEWEMIPIRHVSEPLVSVEKLGSEKVKAEPMYQKHGVPGALRSCFIREGVGERLLQAAALLPEPYTLLVWDGFRPYHVQEAIFKDYFNQLKIAHPDKKNDELMKLTKQYVSRPSNSRTAPSPHITGGSIDVTIAGPDGEVVEMGTGFDDFTARAATCYWEQKAQNETLENDERMALENRRLLFNVMRAAGFTNYREEWWHFDYGNQWWAGLTGAPSALYGVATL